jgi:hypothetical protein
MASVCVAGRPGSAVKFMYADAAVSAVPLLIEPVIVSGYVLASRACRVLSASRRVPLPGWSPQQRSASGRTAPERDQVGWVRHVEHQERRPPPFRGRKLHRLWFPALRGTLHDLADAPVLDRLATGLDWDCDLGHDSHDYPPPGERSDLVAVRTAEKQRAEKLLEAQIKLSVVASDIFGVPDSRCWQR